MTAEFSEGIAFKVWLLNSMKVEFFVTAEFGGCDVLIFNVKIV